MRIGSWLAMILILIGIGHAQVGAAGDLPDAPEIYGVVHNTPSHFPKPKVGFWTVENPLGGDLPLRTNREVWTSKSFVLSEAGYLGVIAFDVEATHQGLAHHRCVEGTGENAHPSRRGLYVASIPEFAVSIMLGWIESRAVWQPLVFQMPAYGFIVHGRGGARWLENCW